jgi:hypothetical protein
VIIWVEVKGRKKEEGKENEFRFIVGRGDGPRYAPSARIE